jgi:hypothetical protein
MARCESELRRNTPNYFKIIGVRRCCTAAETSVWLAREIERCIIEIKLGYLYI